MFDLITEDARGESDSEGEDANLTKYRARMEVLNSDLHEIFDGEDGGEGEGEVESSNIITVEPKSGKMKYSGQNLDLLTPNSTPYIYD